MRAALILCVSALSCTGAARAAATDYFPLQVGNQWTYRAGRQSPFTVEVAGTQTAGGKDYFVVSGWLNGSVWLRADGDTLYSYNPDTKNETVWSNFAAPDGQNYNTGVDPCVTSGRIRSRAASADVPLGHFDNLLAVDYVPAVCADAGITNELYLPYIGLLQRTYTSIAGPVVYDLVYARLNYGLTILTAPEQSFTGSLDVVTATPGSTVNVRMTLRNSQSQALTLTWPTGQRFDVVMRNDKGDVVYQWSRGRLFAQIFGTQQVTSEKTWTLAVPAPSDPGNYTVEAWLATQPVTWRTQLSLTVKPSVVPTGAQ